MIKASKNFYLGTVGEIKRLVRRGAHIDAIFFNEDAFPFDLVGLTHYDNQWRVCSTFGLAKEIASLENAEFALSMAEASSEMTRNAIRTAFHANVFKKKKEKGNNFSYKICCSPAFDRWYDRKQELLLEQFESSNK